MRMSKVTIDRDTFKALASDARLEILKALDGRRMNLSEISRKTNLNKATVHEHLGKLVGVGLIKKIEREGHKWTYYKLSWKGANLLHPENTKIVIMFGLAFVLLINGIVLLTWYVTPIDEGFIAAPQAEGLDYRMTAPPFNETMDEETFAKDLSIIENISNPLLSKICMELKEKITQNATRNDTTKTLFEDTDTNLYVQDPFFLHVGIISITLFLVLLSIAIWRAWKNRLPAL
jgi:DNA-binding transcriptional ArsR family regulator